MSTSRSDERNKSGVAALFARAVEDRRERADASAAPVPPAMEARLCACCGAPREQEVLVCRYCGEKT